MVRRLSIFLAVCALGAATQAAPLSNDKDSETQQTYIVESSEYIQILPSPSHTMSKRSSNPKTEYWIDEFDNLISYTPRSSSKQRRSVIPTTQQSSDEDDEAPRSEQQSLTTSYSTGSLDDNTDAFYRAHVAGYMDIMSKFGNNLDLDQEYINGFSTGVAILVFVVLSIVVMYLVVLPMALAAWRRAAPPLSRGLRGESKYF